MQPLKPLSGGVVSIHAPVRVRQANFQLKSSRSGVSIHAPVRVRHGIDKHVSIWTCFNPRTREGATGGNYIEGLDWQGFNPRTREGATTAHCSACSEGTVSIHAPVRVRLSNMIFYLSKLDCFNPRTREGATG